MQILRESWYIVLAVGALFCLIPAVRSRITWVKWVTAIAAIGLTAFSLWSLATTGKSLDEQLICRAWKEAPSCQPLDPAVHVGPWIMLKGTGSRGTPLCGIVTTTRDSKSGSNVAVKSFEGRPIILSFYKLKWNWIAGTTLNVTLDLGFGRPPIALIGRGEGHMVEVEIPTEDTAAFLLELSSSPVIMATFPNIDEPGWLVEDEDVRKAVRKLAECSRQLNHNTSENAAPKPTEPTKEKSVIETGPSFSCATAKKNATETAICGSATLSAIDGELGSLYRSRLRGASTSAATALKSQQRAWIVDRNRLCAGDAVCLETATRARLTELQQQN